MDIESYLTKRMASLDGETSLVRDFRVFDFAWVPDKPLVRDEARPIIDALLTYGRTGVPQDLVVLGSRGCSKTLPHALPAAVAQGEGGTGDPLRQLSHGQLELQDPGGVPRGPTPAAPRYQELYAHFEAGYRKAPTVVVLDEVNLISKKDPKTKDILYFLLPLRTGVHDGICSPMPPGSWRTFDPSVRSSLQAETSPRRLRRPPGGRDPSPSR